MLMTAYGWLLLLLALMAAYKCLWAHIIAHESANLIKTRVAQCLLRIELHNIYQDKSCTIWITTEVAQYLSRLELHNAYQN